MDTIKVMNKLRTARKFFEEKGCDELTIQLALYEIQNTTKGWNWLYDIK